MNNETLCWICLLLPFILLAIYEISLIETPKDYTNGGFTGGGSYSGSDDTASVIIFCNY